MWPNRTRNRFSYPDPSMPSTPASFREWWTLRTPYPAAASRPRISRRRQCSRPRTEVRRDLETAGISVRSGSVALLSEEAPFAYKDVDEVVDVCDRAGLAAKVARLRPLGVVKG